MMASHMPPIRHDNLSKKGTPSEAKHADKKLVQHEHHGTTNAGYFKGRRVK